MRKYKIQIRITKISHACVSLSHLCLKESGAIFNSWIRIRRYYNPNTDPDPATPSQKLYPRWKSQRKKSIG